MMCARGELAANDCLNIQSSRIYQANPADLVPENDGLTLFVSLSVVVYSYIVDDVCMRGMSGK